jgi:predicted alpha/beta superfamily hydrolase
MTAEPVTILSSEMYMMDSEHTDRTYRITVSLPLSYSAPAGEAWPFNDARALWPTVYVLDGNWYAGMVAGVIRPMRWCGRTTDAIVVGIGYREDQGAMEALRESFAQRDHDLTPVRDEAVEKDMSKTFQRPVPNGDAENFHSFIKDELIPFIEKTYRADPAKRILVGHSYGGLFGLFGLFTTPDLFESLIIGSPTLSYGKRFTFQQEEAFAKTHQQLPIKIYLYAAELEESLDDTTLTDTLRIAAILQGRRYEGLTLVKRIFADQNHCEVAVAGIHWGLMQALKT